jgi:signal recognition particle receptor subunit beta
LVSIKEQNNEIKNSDVVDLGHFVTSVSFEGSPVCRLKERTRNLYFSVLEHILTKAFPKNEFYDTRLMQYHEILLLKPQTPLTDENSNKAIKNIVNPLLNPWRKKYRYYLLCDLALILLYESEINTAFAYIKPFLCNRQSAVLLGLLDTLFNDGDISQEYDFVTSQILQFRRNRIFASKPIKRYVVTANMSSGKSTLINAIIGKAVAFTSQEACTSELSFIYNKPYGNSKSFTPPLKIDVENIENNLNCQTNIAVNFSLLSSNDKSICLVDTPGVNSTINRHHGRLTRKSLKEEPFDKLIYVLNANKLGTDDEMRHLRWVAENLPHEKIVFVINKLDDFTKKDDNIKASIQNVISDLNNIGFTEPVVCPISAYFAYLIKLRQNCDSLDEDEADTYDLLAKKFNKPEYDLSGYYEPTDRNDIAVKCGLYGLENLLFGGTL